MVWGLFRWLRSVVGAVLVLVAGAALTEVALRLRSVKSTGSAIASSAGCPLTIPSWQLGWELRPSAQALFSVETGDSIPFRTNSLGYRGPEVVIPKPPGTYRIVCLGDETLIAPEISEEATFCQQLRAGLQAQTQYPLEIVNAGSPHGCPLTEWLQFRTRVLALQPDLVLVHVTWSDLADDRALRRFTACDRHGVPLSCSHPQLSAKPCVNLEAWREQFCVVDWGCQTLWRKVEDVAPSPSTASIWSNVESTAGSTEYQQMLEPLKHLAALCEASYCRCVVWTTPAPWQLSGSATTEGDARRDAGVPANGLVTSRTPFEVLSQTLAEWKVPCLDASRAFPTGSAADDWFLPDQPRWTTAGNQRVAQFVAAQLMQGVPGPWSSPYFRSPTVPASYTQSSKDPGMAIPGLPLRPAGRTP
jgi:hypothetical protein